MGGLTFHQTAMKDWDMGTFENPRFVTHIRISVRSPNWIHGSFWVPIDYGAKLLRDLRKAGYDVFTTKRFDKREEAYE